MFNWGKICQPLDLNPGRLTLYNQSELILWLQAVSASISALWESGIYPA